MTNEVNSNRRPTAQAATAFYARYKIPIELILAWKEEKMKQTQKKKKKNTTAHGAHSTQHSEQRGLSHASHTEWKISFPFTFEAIASNSSNKNSSLTHRNERARYSLPSNKSALRYKRASFIRTKVSHHNRFSLSMSTWIDRDLKWFITLFSVCNIFMFSLFFDFVWVFFCVYFPIVRFVLVQSVSCRSRTAKNNRFFCLSGEFTKYYRVWHNTVQFLHSQVKQLRVSLCWVSFLRKIVLIFFFANQKLSFNISNWKKAAVLLFCFNFPFFFSFHSKLKEIKMIWHEWSSHQINYIMYIDVFCVPKECKISLSRNEIVSPPTE